MAAINASIVLALNESPYEKVGKFQQHRRNVATADPSMKVPTKK